MLVACMLLGQRSRSFRSIEIFIVFALWLCLFDKFTSFLVQIMRGLCVMQHFQAKGEKSRLQKSFKVKVPWVFWSFSHVSSNPIGLIYFTWATYTIHEETIWHTAFFGQEVKVQGHFGHLKFLLCLLHGSVLIWPFRLIHSIETPSKIDPQWNKLHWMSSCIFHTHFWGAVGCEWGTTSVYFGITYVCAVLSVLAVGPQYQ